MKVWMLFVLAALLAGAAPATAAEHEEEAQVFVYATYFKCDVAREKEVDQLVGSVMKPIWDQAVTDGEISNWGWLRHHTGGSWRRLFYAVGGQPGALMDALEKLNEKLDAKEEAKAFDDICGSHVDYLWRQGASSAQSAADVPGEVGLSVYYECNWSEETFADTLVETSFAPVFNAHVGDGKLASWSWLQHQIGGKYRRLLAFRAEDRNSLMTSWGAIVAELRKHKSAALGAFQRICFSHEDYLWLSGD